MHSQLLKQMAERSVQHKRSQSPIPFTFISEFENMKMMLDNDEDDTQATSDRHSSTTSTGFNNFIDLSPEEYKSYASSTSDSYGPIFGCTCGQEFRSFHLFSIHRQLCSSEDSPTNGNGIEETGVGEDDDDLVESGFGTVQESLLDTLPTLAQRRSRASSRSSQNSHSYEPPQHICNSCFQTFPDEESLKGHEADEFVHLRLRIQDTFASSSDLSAFGGDFHIWK